MSVSARVILLLLLCVEAAVLAVLEAFFLPLRLDGTLLPRVGDLPFPITIVVALVTTPLLVMWAAGLSDRVSAAAAPLLVWFFTLVVLGFAEPGRNAPGFLLGDWRTMLLLVAGMLPGAVAVGAAMARNAAHRPGLYEPAGTQ